MRVGVLISGTKGGGRRTYRIGNKEVGVGVREEAYHIADEVRSSAEVLTHLSLPRVPLRDLNHRIRVATQCHSRQHAYLTDAFVEEVRHWEGSQGEQGPNTKIAIESSFSS